MYSDIIQRDNWTWMYDNLNMSQRVRHEGVHAKFYIYMYISHWHVHNRSSCVYYITLSYHHSSMINATSRLTVNIRYVPNSTNWEDIMTARRTCQSLTINDFTPNDRNGIVLQQYATHYVMGFLVSAFQSLSDLSLFLHPVDKSVMVPMKILFKDEKYKSETIEILQQLMADADLKGLYQVNTMCKMISVTDHSHNSCRW